MIQRNFSHRLKVLFTENRMLSSFLAVTFFVVCADYLFWLMDKAGFLPEALIIQTDWAPECWLGLIALVLGTLLLVISIASQSITKLVDLYMSDWLSLLYVWYMIVSTLHVVIVVDLDRPASHFLNVNVLLLGGLLLAFPYIFYIMRLTKPENIIHKIQDQLTIQFENLMRLHSEACSQKNVEVYQYQLLKSLNQLDDLLSYISFKETKSDILQLLGLLLRRYIKCKKHFPQEIFQVTETMMEDISFRTMTATLGSNDSYPLFFEKKCFRILGNAYNDFVNSKLFDLAALSASELAHLGESLIVESSPENDGERQQILRLILIHFNTLVRFAFKDALKESEQRNLYNLVYHYRLFLISLCRNGYPELLLEGYGYMRYYANEVYKNAAIANLYFIVDTIAFEMKEILQDFYLQYIIEDKFISPQHKEEAEALHLKMLGEFLKVDNPPDKADWAMDENEAVKRSQVRVIQAEMGFFYCKYEKMNFVDEIIDDMLDDVRYIGKKNYRKLIEKYFFLLENVFQPTYWEDTDRGQINIYYADHKEFLPQFRDLLLKKLG